MAKERSDTEETSSEAVKAALLISGADRRKYGKLKDELANNYRLGTDQYPDTFEKALRILGNYQTTTNSLPYRPSPNDIYYFCPFWYPILMYPSKNSFVSVPKKTDFSVKIYKSI